MIYERMNDPNRQSNLTCLHIRRGDKVRGWNKGPQSVYNPWALSIEFYMKALEYARYVYEYNLSSLLTLSIIPSCYGYLELGIQT